MIELDGTSHIASGFLLHFCICTFLGPGIDRVTAVHRATKKAMCFDCLRCSLSGLVASSFLVKWSMRHVHYKARVFSIVTRSHGSRSNLVITQQL